jgi:WD40 repeat protein
MAFILTNAAATKSMVTGIPWITFWGHGIQCLSYFPDSQWIISRSLDKTTWQWDMKTIKEIEEAQRVCEGNVYAVAVSSYGRWIVTGGGGWDSGKLRACEVETGILRTFKGHSNEISSIDISADNTRLASGSFDKTARIWNMDTGELVAGPFKGKDEVGAV